MTWTKADASISNLALYKTFIDLTDFLDVLDLMLMILSNDGASWESLSVIRRMNINCRYKCKEQEPLLYYHNSQSKIAPRPRVCEQRSQTKVSSSVQLLLYCESLPGRSGTSPPHRAGPLTPRPKYLVLHDGQLQC
ncbi:hypothetical protein HZ326_16919 [Fusarium oxysporum f. sp. albedinis]|nr:hypothetical protein HZ326_16919 [Fusarium oxysporum f. sp. albedinis]